MIASKSHGLMSAQKRNLALEPATRRPAQLADLVTPLKNSVFIADGAIIRSTLDENDSSLTALGRQRPPRARCSQLQAAIQEK